MINRTLVRTRVIQTLFAYYKDGGKTTHTAQKELRNSYADTYALYMVVLDFVNVLTAYAEEQIQQAEVKAKITHQDYLPNRRFVRNRWAQQLFDNRELRHYLDNEHLDWDAGMSAVSAIYRELLDAPFYQEYMQTPICTYEDDKRVWRKIFSQLIPESKAFSEALEEMEIVLDHAHWTTDLEMVLSYIPKTIKLFRADSGADVALLPMFDNEDELNFGMDLITKAIQGHDYFEQLIHSNLKNWDAERIAYMDKIILETALAEITGFPNIALEVSFNEYIELSKEYSSDRSYIFINGVLNEIVKGMKRDNSLLKAATWNENK